MGWSPHVHIHYPSPLELHLHFHIWKPGVGVGEGRTTFSLFQISINAGYQAYGKPYPLPPFSNEFVEGEGGYNFLQNHIPLIFIGKPTQLAWSVMVGVVRKR